MLDALMNAAPDVASGATVFKRIGEIVKASWRAEFDRCVQCLAARKKLHCQPLLLVLLVHLDDSKSTTTSRCAGRRLRPAVSAIKAARQGFSVNVMPPSTTASAATLRPSRLRQELDVGVSISPYAYERAPDQNTSSTEKTKELFRDVFSRGVGKNGRSRIRLVPRFLAGNQPITAALGIRPQVSLAKPCYLLVSNVASFKNDGTTDWTSYGTGATRSARTAWRIAAMRHRCDAHAQKPLQGSKLRQGRDNGPWPEISLDANAAQYVFSENSS